MEISLDPFYLALLAGPVVALLAGLLTKLDSSSGVKRIVALALSAVAGVVAQVVSANGVLDLEPVLKAAAVSFASSVVSYYFALKPSGLSEKVNTATSSFGV